MVSSSVVLVTLLALGKYLSVIPKAALSSIVIVNLRGMFRQFLLLPPIWKYSKIDGMVWILTFLITIAFGMLYGLAGGVGLQLIVTTLRSKSKLNQLVQVSNIYRNSQYFSNIAPGDIPIYQFEDSLRALGTH